MRKLLIAAAAACALTAVAQAGSQPYAGQDTREIASLSASDVDALLAGQGWGLAKPAELNGFPGPAHVLELADELGLTSVQRAEIETIFDTMQTEARSLGAAYVEAERHLSLMFRMGHADTGRLERGLADSAALLAKLRAVHLAAHLDTKPLLTEGQIAAYARLRGYGGGQDAHQGHASGGHAHD